VAVRTGPSLSRGAGRADSGIIDKKVETIAVLANQIGEATHLGERRKIGR
jgi:hypothetical protein